MRLAQKFARGLAQDGELQGSISLIFEKPVSEQGVRHVEGSEYTSRLRGVFVV